MDADTKIGGGNANFPDTQHSAIAAVRSEELEIRRPGQEAIVAAYWKPVYRYIRVKWSRGNEDAKDLTQSFFAAALANGMFHGYDAGRGTFRTFLRVCLDRYLANEHKFENRQKRSAVLVALDFDAAGPESPEEVFDREWARGMFEDAINDLRESLEARDRSTCFLVFERYYLAEQSATYAEMARDFGLSAATITNHLAASRRELRRLVLERLRGVTCTDGELEREAHTLVR